MSAFQVITSWKTSTDPDCEARKNRVFDLYAIADGTLTPGPGDPSVVICMDEFGPLNLQPHPGKHWALQASGAGVRPVPGVVAGGRPITALTEYASCWRGWTCPPIGSTGISIHARPVPSS